MNRDRYPGILAGHVPLDKSPASINIHDSFTHSSRLPCDFCFRRAVISGFTQLLGELLGEFLTLNHRELHSTIIFLQFIRGEIAKTGFKTECSRQKKPTNVVYFGLFNQRINRTLPLGKLASESRVSRELSNQYFARALDR
jgi:hypothetical protein